MDPVSFQRRAEPVSGNFGAGDILFQVFQSQIQLVRIEPFRTAAVLGPLQLFDDLAEAVNFLIPVGHHTRHVEDKTLQKGRIRGQIVQVNLHV